MSVATINPTAVPHHLHHSSHHSHLQGGCSSSASRTTRSPPHPHAHGYHRRRLASPISPLSTTYNIHSFNKSTDETIAACDREVQWSFEQEYGTTIEQYMKETEVSFLSNLSDKQQLSQPSAEMMDLQPELEWYMLPFLVDFMIEVHSQFRMSPYTLHLAINLINRYVSKRVVFKKHYQLVGCAALWIAAKFEDAKDKVPTVRELRNMCVGAYEEEMFVQMEGHVLSTLGWEVGGVQTCEAFVEHQISRLRGQHGHVDARLIHLARFFLDLSLFSREFLDYKPSEVAGAAVALARHILGSQQFMQQRHSDREVDCVELFLGKLPSASGILRRKYAHKQLLNVTAVVDDFLAQVAGNKEFQQFTPPQHAHCQHSTRLSEVKTPELRIQLPDTPPHTPVTASTVPQSAKNTSRPGYIVNAAGLPTPPADDDNQKTVHILPSEFSRGSYGRSESFIVESPVTVEAHDEDMDTEYDSEDDEMTFTDDEVEYEYDSEADEEIMITDHHPHHQQYHQSHMHQHYQNHHHHASSTHHDHHHQYSQAPRIVLAPVV